MQVDLSPDDVRFLRHQLMRQLEIMENELVHTDARRLQRDIAAEARRLRDLIDRMPSS